MHARRRRPRFELLESRRMLSASSANDYSLPAAGWFFYQASGDSLRDNESLKSQTLVRDEGVTVRQRWIVRLSEQAVTESGSIGAAIRAVAAPENGFEVIKGLGLPGLVLVESVGLSVGEASRRLSSNSKVEYFSSDRSASAIAEPNDARFGDQWSLENTAQSGGIVGADIAATAAWDMETGSRDTIVAVLDTGVELSHPDLYRNIWLNQGEIPTEIMNQLNDFDSDGLITIADLNDSTNVTLAADVNGNGFIDADDLLNLDGVGGRPGPDEPVWIDGIDSDGNGFTDDLTGWNFIHTVDENLPTDDHGHGTHVSGIIGAEGDNGLGIAGIAWRTSILPLKFLDATNQGFTSDAVAAINYVTLLRQQGHNIRVLNNSWASSEGDTQALRDSIGAAAEQGIVIVSGAGNGDIFRRPNDNDSNPVFPANYEAEGHLRVTATNAADELVPFYNYGAQSVDLAAPGIGILSTDLAGSYRVDSGTSFATAHVSGAAALLASALPADATPTEIRDAILATVDSLPSLEGKTASGGRLNLAATLAADTYQPRVDLPNGVADVVVAGNAFFDVVVRYADNDLVSIASLSDGDITVRNADMPLDTLSVQFIGADTMLDSPIIEATYRVFAPGGTWDRDDNGSFDVLLNSAEVVDAAGNESRLLTNANSQLLGSFVVDILEAGEFRVNTFDDTIDVNPGDGFALDSNGQTSLRAAVMESNTLAGDNRIVLPSGTYTLTLPGSGDDGGDLDITGGNGALTIESPSGATINANNIDRAFEVGSAVVTLSNLTISGGRTASGAGIFVNGGTLTLNEVDLFSNIATSFGGAIYANNSSEVTATNVYIAGNRAEFGGAVLLENSAIVNISGSRIEDNFAGSSGGGFYKGFRGKLSIDSSYINFNQARWGGGIANLSVSNFPFEADDAVSLTNVVMFFNRAIYGASNGNSGGGYGGGIYNRSRMIVESSTLLRNLASHAGGGWFTTNNGSYNHATIENSVITASNASDDFRSFCSYLCIESLGHNVFGTIGGPYSNPGTDLFGTDYSLDPYFPVPENDDYIDSGSNDAAPATDILGRPRPQDADGDGIATVDRGAIELFDGSASGIVFHDINGNGARDHFDSDGDTIPDSVEPGVEGWAVFIDENGNGQLDSNEQNTLTTPSGSWSLSLDPGQYTIAIESRSTWTRTFPLPEQSHTIQVGANQDTSGVDFGAKGETGQISGLIFHDINRDGGQGTGELGVVGWQVYLDLNENGVFDGNEPLSVTDDVGAYEFGDLIPGRYSVRAVPEANWEPTLPTSAMTFLDADFSDGATASLDGFSAVGLWNLADSRGNQSGHSAADSFYFGSNPTQNGSGSYQVGDQGRIISPLIDLTDVRGTVELSFNHLLQLGPDDIATVSVIDQFGAETVIASSEGIGSTAINNTVDRFDPLLIDLPPFAGGAISVAFDVQTNAPEYDTDAIITTLYGGQEYFVQVTGGTVNNYELLILPEGDTGHQLALPQFGGGEDRYDQDDGSNETFVDAQLISPIDGKIVEARLSLHSTGASNPSDVDFFRFTAPATGRYRIGTKSASAPTDLDLELYDENQNLIDSTARGGWYVDDVLVRSTGSHVIELSPGEEISDANFGSFSSSSAGGVGQNAVVSGVVFDDRNANGVRDGNESATANVEVWLDRDQDGVRIADELTITDSEGRYEFRRLPPGVYDVESAGPLDAIKTTPVDNQFAEQQRSTGAGPQVVSLADLNGDQKIDTIVANSGSSSISVLLAEQDGQPAAGGVEYSVQTGAPTFPAGIATGDLDGVNGPEIVVSNFYTGSFAILTNDGSGGFSATPLRVIESLGYAPTAVVVGLFNDDQWLDIAVTVRPANAQDDGKVVLLLNDGAGAFIDREEFTVGISPESLVVTQVNDDNGDGIIDESDDPDLAVANFGNGSAPGTVSILLNNQSGEFAPHGLLTLSDTLTAGRGSFFIATGNLDGQEGMDLAVANPVSGQLSVHLNDNGAFSPPQFVAAPLPTSVAIADLDGDGDLDLATSNARSLQGAPSVTLSRNRGDGTIIPAAGVNLGIGVLTGSPNYSLKAADFNSDGIPDLAVAAGEAGAVKFLYNNLAPGQHKVVVPTDAVVDSVSFGFRAPLNGEVLDRGVYYSNSSFDLDPSGDGAIPTNKRALLPGETATIENYSSYVHGINSLVIDLDGVPEPSAVELRHFQFRTGTSNDTIGWTPLDVPAALSVHESMGVGGVDRFIVQWPDGSIVGTWLEVTILSGPDTGLPDDDIFYFGSQVGDTNGDGLTNAADFVAVRSNLASFLDPASIDNLYDFNRDGLVDAIDLLIVRDYGSTLASGLPMITPTASLQKLALPPERDSDNTQAHEVLQLKPSDQEFVLDEESHLTALLAVIAQDHLENVAGSKQSLKSSIELHRTVELTGGLPESW